MAFGNLLTEPPVHRREQGFAAPAGNKPPFFRGANIQTAGLHNRRIIIRTLRALGRAERQDLAVHTGLTAPAIYKIARDLAEEQLIVNLGNREGGKGQPAAVLALNPDASYAVGISTGHDGMTFACVDFAGHVRLQRSAPIALTDADAAANFLALSLKDLRNEANINLSRIAGIGIAGQRPELQTQISAANTPLFAGLSAPTHFTTPALAAAHAEALLGSGSARPSFLYLHLGDDLNCITVIDQQCVLAGAMDETFGVLPHVNPFRSSKTDLGMTIRQTASVEGLLTRLREKRPDLPFDRIDLADPDIGGVVEAWTSAVADLLYMPLLSIACTLNPKAVYIGGSLPSAVLERLSYAVGKRLSLTLGRDRVRASVAPASFGAAASAVGAALLAFGPKWEGSDSV